MSKDFTSVILFSSEAYVLKNIKQDVEITKLIDQILESEAMGFTNITAALRKGYKELEKIKENRRKIGILITDGDYNRGNHPERIANNFPTLHVINMPPEDEKEKQKRGKKVCQRIAAAGHGKYIPVEEFNEIPRALMNLLSEI
jgi:Mg-chelatase subunit ChlD